MDLPTARLTHHARQRCREMQVSTKRVKRVVRHADITCPGYPGSVAKVAVSSLEPELAVVFVEEEGVPVVLTVLWRGVAFIRP